MAIQPPVPPSDLEERSTDFVRVADASGAIVEVPAAFMPHGPDGSPVEYNQGNDSLIPLRDPRVLCNTCTHGLIIGSPAAVANRRPDGSSFEEDRGWCLISSAGPLSLEQMRPTSCSKYIGAGAKPTLA